MAEEKEKKGVGWVVVWCLFLVGWIAFHRLVHLGNWELLIGLGGFAVWVGLSFAMIWWGLAPRDIFFTFISEGHAKIVIKGGGAFDKILKVWENHRFSPDPDKKWEIEEHRGAVQRGWGGLFLYGFWPWKRIKEAHFQWTNLLDTGEKKKYDEKVREWRLMTQMYVFELPLTKEGGAVEDMNGVPMGFDVVIPIRITNLYTGFFIFDTWLAMLNGVLKPIARRFAGRYRFKEDLIDMRAGGDIEELQIEKGITKVDKDGNKVSETKEGEDLRDKLWQEIALALGQDPTEKVISKYGVELQRQGMDIMNLDPDPAYRELTTAKYKAEQEAEVIEITANAEAKAEKIRGGGIADGTSERTTGAVVRALARLHGKDEDIICEEIDAGKYKDEIPGLYDEVRSREGMDAGAYGELKLPASVEGTILGLVSGVASKLINPTRSSAGGRRTGGKKKNTTSNKGGSKEKLLKSLKEL